MNKQLEMMWTLVLFLAFLLTSNPIKAQSVPADAISTIAWTSNQDRIAIGRLNGSIEVRNASNGQLLLTLNGHSQSILGLAWSPDGSKLASSSVDQTARIWNANNGQSLFTLTHSDVVKDVKWSADGNQIFSNLELSPNNLYVWNTTNGQLISQSSGGGSRIVQNSDRSKLLYLSSRNNIEIWNASTVTLISNYYQPNTPGGDLVTAAWNPSGNLFATGTLNGLVKIWNASTGVITNILQANTAPYSGSVSQRVIDVKFSLDGSKLSSVSNDGTIRVWNTSTWAVTTTTKLQGTIFTAAFSPDATRLAYTESNNQLKIVEMPNRSSSGTGLRVQYFDNLNFVTPKYYVLTPTVNFNWAASAPTGIGVDTFSARWVGKIEPLFSEAYTFYVTHDDGARLWVNGQQVVNNWTNVASAVVDSGTITLAAGVKYDITLEYYENTANASVKLEWQSTSQARQVVPKTQLYVPEGQLIFTGQIGTNNDVYVINPDGTGTTTIANSAASDSGGIWSPDGTKVAFVSLRDGNQEIYMTNADGTGLRRLTNNVAVDKEPCWSPDGTKIIFSSARTGGGDIYSMDITGTGVPTAVRLTTNALNEYRPMYSPVGTKITYVMDTVATGPDIFMMNPDGTSVVQLTTRGGNDVAPFWSPDGTKIALRADISGRGQIFIVTVSPLSVVQATNTATGANYFQSWAPDSSKILFMSTRTGNAEVFTMDTTGNYTNNNQTNLTNTTTSSESYAVWAPDGRSIAYSRDSRIWVMNADGSNQRQLTTVTNRYDYEIAWWQPLQIA